MGYPIQLNSTSRPLLFLMVDSSDHLTGKTGLSPSVTISKNGAAFGAPAGAVTEVANGWYKVAGNATDSNTVGALLLHATATGADPTDEAYDVVGYNPHDAVRLGLTGLANAVAGANGGLPLVDANNAVKVQTGTGANQLDVTSGVVQTDVAKLGGNATALARLTNLMKAAQTLTVDTSTFSATTTVFETTDSTDNDLFTNQAVYFVTGPNAGMTVGVTTYNYSGNSKVKLTVDALPHAPTNGDVLLIFGRFVAP
jgi:hypothetical protein